MSREHLRPLSPAKRIAQLEQALGEAEHELRTCKLVLHDCMEERGINELLAQERTNVLNLLWEASDTESFPVVRDVAVDAGLLWLCPCGTVNSVDDEPNCDDCGGPRL